MLIYTSKHAKLPMSGGKNAIYDKIDSKELPIHFVWHVEPCAVVRQSGKSAAYAKIGPKELIRGLKQGVYKGGAYIDDASTGVPLPGKTSNGLKLFPRRIAFRNCLATLTKIKKLHILINYLNFILSIKFDYFFLYDVNISYLVIVFCYYEYHKYPKPLSDEEVVC